MMSINNFLLFEQLSSVSEFLKSNYDKIFNDPNQALNNLYDSSKKTQKSSASVMNLTSKKKYGKKSSFFNYI